MSLTKAAACPSLAVGTNLVLSSCVQRFVRGSYDQTSLNHCTPFVLPNLVKSVFEYQEQLGESSQIKLIIEADDGVTSPGRRNLSWRRSTLMTIFNQEFPLVFRVLKSIKIKSYQIVEEASFNLATKDIDL